MRILRIAPWIHPDSKGGGQYHVHALSRDQAELGHEVTVVTTRDDGALPVSEETDGYTIDRVPNGITIAGNDISHGIARYLWKHGAEYDVVHAHSHLYFSTNLASAYRRLNDVPLAITNHGLYSQSAPEWLFDVYLQTLGQWTFEQADVVFCYTETDRQRVRDLGVSSRIEVVPNGIDTERFTPEGPESELIDAEGPVALFVGRFVAGKRPGLAVEAFDEVQEEHPNAELYLCGEGPLRGELEAQVRDRDIERSVTFLGHVAYDEMPAVYRSADVMVLPSRAEGTPRTVLEAKASGTPVVVSDLGQLTSIVDDAGQVVSMTDISNVAQAIGEYLDESAMEGTGDRVPDAEMEAHRWQDTVARTTGLLQDLAGSQSGRPPSL